jgi:hypothetical protein
LSISTKTVFRSIKKLEEYNLIKKYRSIHTTFFFINFELIKQFKIVIDNKLNNKNIIKSFSFNQSQIMRNILDLYCNCDDSFQLDPTYSTGGFYQKSNEFPIKQPKIKFDVNPHPKAKNVIKIEALGRWNLHDNTVKSIIFDLPFIVTSGKSLKEPLNPENKNNLIWRRFSGYSNKSQLLKSHVWFIKESFRVLRHEGILVVKCQKCVSGGNVIFLPEFVFETAKNVGFIPLDRFILLSHHRLISGNMVTQQHARSFDCQIYVFKKIMFQETTIHGT